jgi:hypothetical protein
LNSLVSAACQVATVYKGELVVSLFPIIVLLSILLPRPSL